MSGTDTLQNTSQQLFLFLYLRYNKLEYDLC